MNLIHAVEPRPFPTREHAAYWENFLTDEDINFILAQPEWLTTTQAAVGSSMNQSVNKDVRIANVGWLYSNPENLHIWHKITNAIADVNAKFFNFHLTGLYEPAQLTVYYGDDGAKYEWHTDYSASLPVPRKLSMVLMLSDPEKDFTGGELQAKFTNDQPVNLEFKRGRAWFFPSYMFHRVAPVTSGIRRTLILWVGGPDYK